MHIKNQEYGPTGPQKRTEAPAFWSQQIFLVIAFSPSDISTGEGPYFPSLDGIYFGIWWNFVSQYPPLVVTEIASSIGIGCALLDLIDSAQRMWRLAGHPNTYEPHKTPWHFYCNACPVSSYNITSTSAMNFLLHVLCLIYLHLRLCLVDDKPFSCCHFWNTLSFSPVENYVFFSAVCSLNLRETALSHFLSNLFVTHLTVNLSLLRLGIHFLSMLWSCFLSF